MSAGSFYDDIIPIYASSDKVFNNQEKIFKDYGKASVYIDLMSDFEIYDWIDKSNPYDKAGAYAIQEEFGKYITKIEGELETFERNFQIIRANWSGTEFDKAAPKLLEIKTTLERALNDQRSQKNYS